MSKRKESDSVNADVLSYFKRTNRPYSLNDIVAGLKKDHGKTAISKAIDTLVAEKEIIEKTYGKQKVYFLTQSGETFTNEELEKMDTDIEEKKKQLSELKAKLKTLNSDLNSLTNKMSIDELKSKITQLEEKKNSDRTMLESLTNNPNIITKEESEKIHKEYTKAKDFYNKRKRLFMEVFNNIRESSGKGKDELNEEIGIETDEAVGFAIKTF